MSFIPKQWTNKKWEDKRLEKLARKKKREENKRRLTELGRLQKDQMTVDHLNQDYVSQTIESLRSFKNQKIVVASSSEDEDDLGSPAFQNSSSNNSSTNKQQYPLNYSAATRIRGNETLHGIKASEFSNPTKKSQVPIVEILVNNSQIALVDPITKENLLLHAKSIEMKKFDHDVAIRNNEMTSKFSWIGSFNDMCAYTTKKSQKAKATPKPTTVTKTESGDFMLSRIASKLSSRRNNETPPPPNASNIDKKAPIPEQSTEEDSEFGENIPVLNLPGIPIHSIPWLLASQNENHQINPNLQQILSPTICKIWNVYYDLVDQKNDSKINFNDIENQIEYKEDEEAIDSFAVFINRLNISTTNSQYKLVTNVVENLILEAEPIIVNQQKQLNDYKQKIKEIENRYGNVKIWEKYILQEKQELRNMLQKLYEYYSLKHKLKIEILEKHQDAAISPSCSYSLVNEDSIDDLSSNLSRSGQFKNTLMIEKLKAEKNLNKLNKLILLQQEILDSKSKDLYNKIRTFKSHKVNLILDNENKYITENHHIRSISNEYENFESHYKMKIMEILCNQVEWNLVNPTASLATSNLQNFEGSGDNLESLAATRVVAQASLNDFLYVKHLYNNDKVSHRFELGCIEVKDMTVTQPPSATESQSPSDSSNTQHRINPQHHSDICNDSYILRPKNVNPVPNNAHLSENLKLNSHPLLPQYNVVRILTEVSKPVGGISIKDYIEVKLECLDLRYSSTFYSHVSQFFFPDVGSNDQDRMIESEAQVSMMDSSSSLVAQNNSQNNAKTEGEPTSFVNVKIPIVELNLNYKQGPIEFKNKVIRFQEVQFSNQIWTWHDLISAVKDDYKSQLFNKISSALKPKWFQKLSGRRKDQ